MNMQDMVDREKEFGYRMSEGVDSSWPRREDQMAN